MTDRERLLKDIAEYYGVTRAAAKELMLRVSYGGAVEAWARCAGLGDDAAARVGRDGHCGAVIAFMLVVKRPGPGERLDLAAPLLLSQVAED